MSLFGDPPSAILLSAPPPNKPSKKSPQGTLVDFWSKFTSKHPGKVTSIFPRSLYATVVVPGRQQGLKSARNAAESYEAAAKECRTRVNRIVLECRRTNERFTDPDFDIEHDEYNNCLNGLVQSYPPTASANAAGPPNVSSYDLKTSLQTLVQSQMLGADGRVPIDVGALGRFVGQDGGVVDEGEGGSGSRYDPGSVHRVDWIFPSPQFTVGGFSSMATIAHRKDLMEKVCVKYDEDCQECGVYGFVFQRDGGWVPVVVDDNLYLKEQDFDYYGDIYDPTGKKARKHRRDMQTGADALYFARCDDQNETWLPILEKAYAKVHGDYAAINGGWPGEAVEDMTGGVTTTIASNRVLSKHRLWKELSNKDGEFVFALAAMGTGWDNTRSGLALGHAYSILDAREEPTEDLLEKKRLVKIRNPWGERAWNGLGEWNGPWSDGSREWTSYWLKKMGHTFGDDGVFWMEYGDMLETFMFLHRTRLFDERWTVVQQWTSTNVSWLTGYLQTKFVIEVKKAGVVVIVLTQLDDRYFQGLEGQYWFELHFLLREIGSPTGEHVCRVRPVHSWENRSVSCEVELEPGNYEVLPKIAATRNENKSPVEEVVKEYADRNPQKLRQVGMQYDLAHAKGGVVDEDEALEKEEKKDKLRAKQKKAMGQAASAMEKAAEAMKEMSGGDKKGSTDVKSDEEKKSGADSDKQSVEKQTTSAETKGAEKPSEAQATTESRDPSDEATRQTEAPKEANALVEPQPQPEEVKVEGPAVDVQEESEESDSEDSSGDEDDAEGPTSPWNAVCVLGLRVYARDPDVSIKLVKPTEKDENTSLMTEGQPAGATM
ncbi:Uu.00g129390.m01.CDS01 [Anthostomella pinea]|uniref:Uu.00g129390.m01.CDS01 n=1 Tax=Anthostomella pinea TaxID=933095 RepID=A0AAI8VJF7_9PEZI|nr:Uu.00g129390.m01.CDS01 [Anthostomella pinea]